MLLMPILLLLITYITDNTYVHLPNNDFEYQTFTGN